MEALTHVEQLFILCAVWLLLWGFWVIVELQLPFVKIHMTRTICCSFRCSNSVLVFIAWMPKIRNKNTLDQLAIMWMFERDLEWISHIYKRGIAPRFAYQSCLDPTRHAHLSSGGHPRTRMDFSAFVCSKRWYFLAGQAALETPMEFSVLVVNISWSCCSVSASLLPYSEIMQ